MSIQWGVRYQNNQIYSRDYCCPTCDWRPDLTKNETFGTYTIGIDSEAPLSKQPNMIAAQIVKCPKDGTFFWMHLDENRLNTYRELYPEKFSKLKLPSETKEHKGRRK
jgi:hypothetical protein